MPLLERMVLAVAVAVAEARLVADLEVSEVEVRAAL
jgi:hypothetical protein